METWVLLFMIIVGGRPTVMSVEYYDKGRCEQAGAAMTEAIAKASWATVVWRCTPKGEKT